MTLRRFDFDSCHVLHDEGYNIALLDALESATSRVWINMFYIAVGPAQDRNFHTRRLLGLLQEKSNDGLSVRILLGTPNSYSPLEVQNTLVARVLNGIIPVRRYGGSRMYSHRKYVLIDEDLTLLGSHNWSDRSLSRGRDDSVRMASSDLASYLSNDFHRSWRASNEYES